MKDIQYITDYYKELSFMRDPFGFAQRGILYNTNFVLLDVGKSYFRLGPINSWVTRSFYRPCLLNGTFSSILIATIPSLYEILVNLVTAQ